MKKTWALFLFAFSVYGQNLDLKQLPLADLSVFDEPSPSWFLASKTLGTPTATTLKTTIGRGVLLNKTGKDATQIDTKLQHGDAHLELEFLLAKGSKSAVYIQGRYAIVLSDSWQVDKPQKSDCGAIGQAAQSQWAGTAPRVNACKAPGTWQKLSIDFQAPRFDASGKKTANAIFKKVTLNGAILHENIEVSGPSFGAKVNKETLQGPLVFHNQQGQIAFRNIQYALLENADIAWSQLTYQSYDFDGNLQNVSATPKSSGTVGLLDPRVAEIPNKFYLKFTGKLHLPTTDNYVFTLQRNGISSLKIDGETVIKTNWMILPDQVVVTKNLSQGDHDVELMYAKDFSWRPTSLALTVQKTNSRPVALHETTAVPEPDPEPLIAVDPTFEAKTQRSYWQLPTRKLTHVMSVGTPAKRHFAYDLDQATPFLIWYGGFLRTTDMWFERGEPQTADAQGASIGIESLAPLGAGTDSLKIDKDIWLKNYKLIDGVPTFSFKTATNAFTDRLSPTGRGLSRETVFEKAPGQIRLCKAKSLDQVGKGLYLIDGLFYVQTKDKSSLELSNDGLVKIKNTLTNYNYEIIW